MSPQHLKELVYYPQRSEGIRVNKGKPTPHNKLLQLHHLLACSHLIIQGLLSLLLVSILDTMIERVVHECTIPKSWCWELQEQLVAAWSQSLDPRHGFVVLEQGLC